MSETPGSERPQDDEGRRRSAPYPGWSVEQPPRWTDPGASGSQWTAPGQPADQTRPSGPQAGGWQQGRQPPPGHSGWGAGPAWGPAPTVKPGVIPLRPLGVGEILDGAVTTIRRNPGPMLGFSALVAVITQLLGLAASWLILNDLQDIATVPETAPPGEVLTALTSMLAVLFVFGIVNWIATVILTGVLTVVVGRAVLGERLKIAEAWATARPRLLRLLALTLVFALIVASPIVAAALLGVLTIVSAGESAAGLLVLMALIALSAMVWLYVRYALATPALMLESTPVARHRSRPVGIVGALRRSSQLVRRSWWRVFGVLLLIWLIALIVGQVLQVPFSIPTYFVDPYDPEAIMSFGILVLSALGAALSTAIISPFVAAATALLYVDRRIRSEGLDIDLARAAGVSIPGRTDQPPPT